MHTSTRIARLKSTSDESTDSESKSHQYRPHCGAIDSASSRVETSTIYNEDEGYTGHCFKDNGLASCDDRWINRAAWYNTIRSIESGTHEKAGYCSTGSLTEDINDRAGESC